MTKTTEYIGGFYYTESGRGSCPARNFYHLFKVFDIGIERVRTRNVAVEFEAQFLSYLEKEFLDIVFYVVSENRIISLREYYDRLDTVILDHLVVTVEYTRIVTITRVGAVPKNLMLKFQP